MSKLGSSVDVFLILKTLFSDSLNHISLILQTIFFSFVNCIPLLLKVQLEGGVIIMNEQARLLS